MVTESGKANDGRNEAIKMLIGKMSFSDDDENHIHLSVLYTFSCSLDYQFICC